METLFGAVVFVFAVIWAFHVERNTARTAEALTRLEKILEKKGK